MSAAALRGLVVAIVLAMVAASCSGGDENVADAPENAPIEQIDEGSGGVSTGAITGLLTSQASFGFGVYDVDGSTGQAVAVPGIASVESISRDTDFIVSDGAAYSLGFIARQGQSFAHDFSVVKIDYETGQVSQVAALGFDRETDDSTTWIDYRLEAVAGDRLLVSGTSDGESTFTVYDAGNGDEKATFARPSYSFDSDAGSCSGNVDEFIGLSDDRVAGIALGSPAILDLDNGEVELLIDCDQETPELTDLIGPAQLNDYVVFSEGPAPTDEQVAQLLMSDLQTNIGFVEGDGDLWWISAEPRSAGEVKAIVGGVVQFDLESNTVEKVHPLGAHLGAYTGCAADSEVCSVRTIERAQLRFFDGRLLILDGDENGNLLTLDPATSSVRVTEFDRGAGIDFTDADLLTGDPNSVWIEVRRMTVVSDDENGRSSAGQPYIELFDLATGQIRLSLAAEELFS